MPTGYTAAVADGTVTELKPFALTLARGMGALIMMRDEPFDAPIPDRFEPSEYHVEKLKELRLEQARLMNLSDEQIEEEIAKELAEFNNHRSKSLFEHIQQKARYQAMIEKARVTGAA